MKDEASLFRLCLAASLAMHGGLFLAGRLGARPRGMAARPIEIDLAAPAPPPPAAKPGGGARAPGPPAPGPAPLLPARVEAPQSRTPSEAPKPLPPDLPPPPPEPAWKPAETPAPKPAPPPEPPPAPAPPSPGTGSQASAGPIAGGAGAGGLGSGGHGGGGTGIGTGAGAGSGAALRPPRLLNRGEMLSILKRFYPERERRAGREGRVVLAVLIGADGIAEPEDVVVSAGRDFDAAAAEVVRLMRFEPASGPQGPFAVRLKQAVDFRLQD